MLVTNFELLDAVNLIVVVGKDFINAFASDITLDLFRFVVGY